MNAQGLETQIRAKENDKILKKKNDRDNMSEPSLLMSPIQEMC